MTLDPIPSAREATDFYVGYRPRASSATRRFLRRVVICLLLGSATIAILLAALQKPFDPGTFEYGWLREFAGVIRTGASPELLVARPGRPGRDAAPQSSYLLVAPGKRGAGALLEGLDGQSVQLQGTLVFRDTETLIEVQPRSIAELSRSVETAPATPRVRDLGRYTLRGEIVDAKCYLGVMKPGRETPHRACAVRCISGGIPPVLVVQGGRRGQLYLLLAGPDGQAVHRDILDYVAEPVEISGRVEQRGDRLTLLADIESLRRAPE